MQIYFFTVIFDHINQGGKFVDLMCYFKKEIAMENFFIFFYFLGHLTFHAVDWWQTWIRATTIASIWCFYNLTQWWLETAPIVQNGLLFCV